MKILLVLLSLLSVTAFADTSTAERARKSLEISVQSGGDYRMSPTQFSIMKFIDGDNLIGLKGGSDREGKEMQTHFAIQYKHYASNSFYIAPEIFYLNSREEENWLYGIFGIPRKYAQYTSLGAGIRIGNQWTWKHFTLGADWIGVGTRFGTFKKEADLDNTTFTILNVIAGISF